jgi:hypothetical protein
VSDFSFLNWTNLRSFQCRYSYRLSVKRQKLDLKCVSILLDVYYCTDISRFQPLSGNTLFLDHAIMFFDHSRLLNRVRRYQPGGL